MKVSKKDIIKAFEDLLSKTRTRESIADWANEAISADNRDELEYEPAIAEDIIWDGIEYLSGVDLKDTPESYLHTMDDFSVYWATLRTRI